MRDGKLEECQFPHVGMKRAFVFSVSALMSVYEERRSSKRTPRLSSFNTRPLHRPGFVSRAARQRNGTQVWTVLLMLLW